MSRERQSRVYGTRWQKLRRVILERDNYQCQIRGPKCKGMADQVDHIIPWRDGGALYDPDNLRAACHTCNSRRAKREGVGAVKRRPSREW